MDAEDVISLRDMCRTCMKQFCETQEGHVESTIHSIYEVPNGYQNNVSFMEILQSIEPSIKISIKDNLPKILCSKCIAKLLNAYEFLDTYKEVDKKYRKMLKKLGITGSNDHLELTDEKDDFVEVLDVVVNENETHDITKVEFEIEDVKNNITQEFLVENEIGWQEMEDEPLGEMSEVYKKKESEFDDTYDSKKIRTGWQEVVDEPLGEISEAYNKQQIFVETYDKHKKPTPYKACQKNRRRQKKNEKIHTENDFWENEKFDQIDLPPQNENGSVSCRECDTVLENLTTWQKHMRQHRLGEKYSKGKTLKSTKMGFECEYCSKVFPRNAAYVNHIRTHTGEEPYLCIECGKSFKVVSSLNTHMLRHRGEKTYQCPQCPKKFVCSSGLYGHMMVHSKEKPYVCDICGSAFHMAYQLKNHNLYHSGTKKFQCDYCDMRFVTSEKQRRHMRTHTGEKPYRCKYCERAFAQSNDCIKHLRQHLGDNVYQCELCPLRFPMARDMKAHFAAHKDDDEETRARNLQARLEEERKLRIKLGVHES